MVIISKKQIWAILLLLILFLTSFPFGTSAEAFPKGLSKEAFLQYLQNSNIRTVNQDGNLAAYDIYVRYGVIVYGDNSNGTNAEHGDRKKLESSNNPAKNTNLCDAYLNTYQYRYIGYTLNGSSVTNGCFPNDEDAGGSLENRNWVQVSAAEGSWDRLQTAQINQLLYTRLTGNGVQDPRFTVSREAGQKGIISQKMAQVVSPPTLCTQGSVRMNHQTSGQLWYATFFIEPFVSSCEHALEAAFSVPQTEYVMTTTQDEITISGVKLTTRAKFKGYFDNSSYVDSLKAKIYQGNVAMTNSKQSSVSVTANPIKIKRTSYTRPPSGVTNAEVELKGYGELWAFGQKGETGDITVKIRIRIEWPDPVVPDLIAACNVNPTSSYYTEATEPAHVPVTGTVNATIFNVPAANVDYFKVQTSTTGGEQYQMFKETPAGDKTKLTQSISFQINMTKRNGKAKLAETFKFTVHLFTKDGKVYAAETQLCTSTVHVGPVPPEEIEPTEPTESPGPSEEPDNNLPPIAFITAPNEIKAGEQLYTSGFGSYDPEDGTNITYAWYSWPVNPDGSNGPVTVRHTTQDGMVLLPDPGYYYVNLTVADTQGKTGSTYKYIHVTPPTPDARIVVTGDKKEKRHLVLSGAGSSSPAAYPLVASASTWTVTALETDNTVAINTIGAMNGNSKLDAMFRTPGEYRVTYRVQNTLGLTDTASILLTIAPDDPPIARLDAPLSVFRNPQDDNTATIPIVDSSVSPDGDQIGHRSTVIRFDSDNDGSFDDETPISGGAWSNDTYNLSSQSVGKYRIRHRITETFDAGPFASMLTAADYLSSDWFEQISEIDNVAPSTGINTGRTYRSDVVFNIGELTPQQQTALSAALPGFATQLQAKGIDANIQTYAWDPLESPDFLQDSAARLKNSTWQPGTSGNLFVGLTNRLSSTPLGSAMTTLQLQPIALSPTPYPGGISTARKTADGRIMAIYGSKSGTVTTYYHSLINRATGTVTNTGTGFSFDSNDVNNQSAFGRLELDTNGQPYAYVTKYKDTFRAELRLYAPLTYGTVQLADTPNNYRQTASALSIVGGVPTIWSAGVLQTVDFYQQQYNYWRTNVNWNPASYGSMPSNTYEVYQRGVSVGSNVYWFGYNGSLFRKYNNGSLKNYSFVSSVFDAWATGSSAYVLAANQYDLWLLRFDNGELTTSQKIEGVPGTRIEYYKYLPATDSIYGRVALDGGKMAVFAYNLSEMKVSWVRLLQEEVTIHDILPPDAGGTEPYFLYTMGTVNNLFLSKHQDTGAVATDMMKKLRGALLYETVYPEAGMNENGTYAFTSDYAFTPTNLIAVPDSRAILVHKVKPGSEGKAKTWPIQNPYDQIDIYKVLVRKNGTVMLLGKYGNNYFFWADETDGFVQHTINTQSGSSNYELQEDLAGNVYLFGYQAGQSTTRYLLKFNAATRTFTTILTGINASEMLSYAIDNDKITLMNYNANSSTNTAKLYMTQNNGAAQTIVDSYTWSGQNYPNAYPQVDYDSNHYYYALSRFRVGTGNTVRILTDNPAFQVTNKNIYISGAYEHMRLIVTDKPYLYVKRDVSASVEIYEVTVQGNSIVPVLRGYIQNNGLNIMTSRRAGHTDKLYEFDAKQNQYATWSSKGMITNLSAAETYAGPTSFGTTIDLTGFDAQIFSSYSKPEERPIYDSKRGGFYRMRVPDVKNLEFYFYSPVQKQYRKTTMAVYNSYGSSDYVNGKYYFSLYGTAADGYTDYLRASIFRATENGVTLLYTPPALTSGNYFVSVAEDHQGYVYILLTWNTGTGRVSSLVHNRSGVFVSTPVTMPTTNIYKIAASNGKLIYYPSPMGNNYQYGIANLTTPTAPAFGNFGNVSSTNYLDKMYGAYYDNQGRVHLLGYVSGSQGQAVVALSNGTFIKGTAVHFGDTTITITGQDFTYILDAVTLQMLHAGPVAKFILPSGGKGLTYSLADNKPQFQVVTFREGSETPTDLVNQQGLRNLTMLLGGGAAVRDELAYAPVPGLTYLPWENNDAEALLDRVGQQLFNTLREADPAPLYFTADDVPALQKIYADYESDPTNEEKWVFLHDPDVFENTTKPDGTPDIIPEHGQAISGPPATFKPGRYEATYRAQDNPSMNSLFASYRRWSDESDKAVFYIHRRPIAHFTATMRPIAGDTMNADVNVLDDSYDLDHESAFDKGLVSRKWKWKPEADSEWTEGEIPAMLPRGRVYMATLDVTDREGASASYSLTFNTGVFAPNEPPKTVIAYPAGLSAATATIALTEKPTIKWTYTDRDGDPQTAFTVNVYRENGTLHATSGNVTSTNKEWTLNTAMVDGVNYQVEVRANDGFDWGAYSNRKWMKIESNEPPTADFTWTPTVVYEDDTVAFGSNVTDPDHDTLSVAYRITSPTGAVQNFSYTLTYPYASTAPTVKLPTVGNWTVRMTVGDGEAADVVVTKTVAVRNLAIQGFVRHSDRYEELRRAYNRNAGGDPEYPRAFDLFAAGEVFDLAATTTDTGASSTKAQSVIVTREPFDYAALLTSNTKLNWTGKLIDRDNNLKLTDGTYRFTFTAVWTNGHTESVVVPIRIKDDIYEVYFQTTRMETY